jgi:hypothetical protein
VQMEVLVVVIESVVQGLEAKEAGALSQVL